MYPVHGQSHGQFTAPKLSHFRRNQAGHRGHRGDFTPDELLKITNHDYVVASTSARIPDVPLQVTDCVYVAGTVREYVRVSEGQQYAD